MSKQVAVMKRTNPTLADHFVTIKSVDEAVECTNNHFKKVKKVFDDLSSTRVMELLRHNKERAKYLLNYHCKVIAAPIDSLLLHQEELLEAQHKVSALIVIEASQLSDFEAFASLVVGRSLRRVIMIGNKMDNPPFITSRLHHYTSGLGNSMFARLAKLHYPLTRLYQQFGVAEGIHKAVQLLHPDLELASSIDTEALKSPEAFQVVNVASKEVAFDDAA